MPRDIKELKFDFQFCETSSMMSSSIRPFPHIMVVALVGNNHRMQPERFAPRLIGSRKAELLVVPQSRFSFHRNPDYSSRWPFPGIVAETD